MGMKSAHKGMGVLKSISSFAGQAHMADKGLTDKIFVVATKAANPLSCAFTGSLKTWQVGYRLIRHPVDFRSFRAWHSGTHYLLKA
jgi:hypothetical protein